MVKHYVEFVVPGSFFNDYITRPIKERDPNLVVMPKEAVAYRFFDRTEKKVDGEKLHGKRKNYSPFTYYGTEYTLEEITSKFPYLANLIINLKSNGYTRAVKTTNGNWQPLSKNDLVLPNQ